MLVDDSGVSLDDEFLKAYDPMQRCTGIVEYMKIESEEVSVGLR